MLNKLICDTREQLPLIFYNTENYEVIRDTLLFGDYAIKINDKILCIFERKSPVDLYGTLTSGHDRFKAELQKARESGIPFYIIVEENYNNIINKKFEGAWNIKKIQGWQLAKTIHTYMIRYKLIFIFCNNRAEARDYIRNTFNAVIKEYEKTQKIAVIKPKDL